MKSCTDRILFVNTSLRLTALVYPSEMYPGWWRVKVALEGPDRDTGAPGSFAIEHRFRFARRPGRERLAKWVRQTVRALVLHEVDEALHVDGVRMFDPHKKRRLR